MAVHRHKHKEINYDILPRLWCSPVSKLSGLLYTIYTNEVPILHKILENTNICRIIRVTPAKNDISEHIVMNFVDDNNSVISGTENTELEHYIKKYFQSLEVYYNSRKLKINASPYMWYALIA